MSSRGGARLDEAQVKRRRIRPMFLGEAPATRVSPRPS